MRSAHARLLSVEKGSKWTGINTKQATTYKWRGAQFMYNKWPEPRMERIFEALIRSPKHACIPGERGCSTRYFEAPCCHLIRQNSILTPNEEIPPEIIHLVDTDPAVRKQSECANYGVLVASLALTNLFGQRKKVLSEAGHLVGLINFYSSWKIASILSRPQCVNYSWYKK